MSSTKRERAMKVVVCSIRRSLNSSASKVFPISIPSTVTTPKKKTWKTKVSANVLYSHLSILIGKQVRLYMKYWRSILKAEKTIAAINAPFMIILEWIIK